MDYLINKMEVNILKNKISYLFYYAAATSLFCVLLLLVLLTQDKKVIVTPPDIKQNFWVSDHAVSESYLTQMSDFFLTLALDKTPGNAKYQTQSLLKYVDPNLFNTLKQKMSAEDDRIIKENITTSFFPVKQRVWYKKMRVEVTGDFVSRIGDKVMPTQRISYFIQYSYRQGYLHITQFYHASST